MQQRLDQPLLETSPKALFTSPLFSLGRLFGSARVGQVIPVMSVEIRSKELLAMYTLQSVGSDDYI